MPEYITKAQAIDIAESLRNIAGDTITNAFVKGIEGIKGGFTGFYDQNGKSVCEPYHGTWHRTPKE